MSVLSLVIKCPECKLPMRDVVVPGHHLLHWVVLDGRRVRINCQRKEVAP